MTDDEMIKIARTAARRYRARCPWAEEDDLVQEALAIMLRAQRSFDRQRGTPEEVYLWRSAMRSLSSWVRRQLSPVSAHDVRMLEGHERADLNDVHKCARPSPEDDLARHTLWERVRGCVHRAARGSAVAEQALLDGPATAAEEQGVLVRVAYRAAARARMRLRQDHEALELWEECDA